MNSMKTKVQRAMGGKKKRRKWLFFIFIFILETFLLEKKNTDIRLFEINYSRIIYQLHFFLRFYCLRQKYIIILENLHKKNFSKEMRYWMIFERIRSIKNVHFLMNIYDLSSIQSSLLFLKQFIEKVDHLTLNFFS